MSPLDRDIIKRKLAVIAGNLDALQRISGLGRHEYEKDLFLKKGTERLIQELIEAAIDINTHLIVELGGSAPDTYFDAFLRLGDLRVIPDDLARRLAPSAGLRNRLVHEYDIIDDAIILASVDDALKLYAEYVRIIKDFVDRQP
jgi:uncharacterized protein YutE (UPF0331/DUF86 family)